MSSTYVGDNAAASGYYVEPGDSKCPFEVIITKMNSIH